MDVFATGLLFFHVLGGAIWLGGSVFANVVALPFVFAQPEDRQAELVRRLILGPERLMIAAAAGGGALGIVLGLTGRIRSVDSLTTTYGLVWLLAIAVIAAVFATGGRVTSPAIRAFLDGTGANQQAARDASARIRLGFRLELAGITAALVLMSVLRSV